MKHEKIKNLAELKKSGYQSVSIKQEIRANLIRSIKQQQDVFQHIIGYENTVIPELQTALLSGHHINLLGLRGQAKTMIARNMIQLLDEWIPIVEGSEINDDPLKPISKFALNQVKELGDLTPISWLHRSERYVEKLATPDVSVADLIGDIDPIKAANLKLSLSHEEVLNFGLLPRSNRCIFVINELPDLQARIQVALFNILQEGDVQIRGFKFRIPLDIQFVFTANPEDYTNRGSIVTPLKDRIGSQILTHYPKNRSISSQITQQEAKISQELKNSIYMSSLVSDLIEQVAIEARQSEYVDIKSGVSARLTISAFENAYSTAELRLLKSTDKKTILRIADVFGIVPAINGKIELVYEGEQEGAATVSNNLISKAIRSVFLEYFPDPSQLKRKNTPSPFAEIIEWFDAGNQLELENDNNQQYHQNINKVPGLIETVKKYCPTIDSKDLEVYAEFLLHGLAEFSQINKKKIGSQIIFNDLFGSMISKDFDNEEL